jgi:hypothetical protein
VKFNHNLVIFGSVRNPSKLVLIDKVALQFLLKCVQTFTHFYF